MPPPDEHVGLVELVMAVAQVSELGARQSPVADAAMQLERALVQPDLNSVPDYEAALAPAPAIEPPATRPVE